MPCDGKEFIIIWKLAPKEHKVFSEVVLSGKDAHSWIRERSTWEVIDFLIGAHFLENVQFSDTIDPGNIKVHAGDGIDYKVPLVFFTDMFNNGILSF